MEIMPTGYPKAYEMTKQIVQHLQSSFLSNSNLKAKYWLIDFIESHEGITYFIQVKAFKCSQTKSITKMKSLNRSKANLDKGKKFNIILLIEN